MTLASALDSLNTFHIEPLNAFLQIAFVVISSFLLAIYLLTRFALKPLGKRLWHRLFHGLSRPFIIGEIFLIILILAITGGFITIAKTLWPSYTSKAIVAAWGLIIIYVPWKRIRGRTQEPFDPLARPLADGGNDPESFFG